MVRFTELSAARRGALQKLKKAPQSGGQILARFHSLVAGDDSLGIVSVDGGPELRLPLSPGKYVPGSLVSVLVDAAGKPVRVLAPRTDRPEGADDTAVFTPVTAHQALAPLSPEQEQAIVDSAAGLADAQGRLADAEGLLDALDAADGPAGVAAALTDYLAIPLDQITVVDNRGPDGQVVAQLYDSIIVDGLLTAEKVITPEMAVNGFLEARHLNVVPAEGTGGVEILPPGIRIIPAGDQAGTAISMRVDEPNWIAFAQDGQTTFSVSPSGHVAATSMSVTGTFNYQGTELSQLLDLDAKGVIASSNLTQSTLANLGWAKIGHVTFRSLAPNRRIRATLDLNTNNGTTPRVQVACMRADGTLVTSNNSIQRLWEHGDGRVRGSGLYPHEFNAAGTGVQTVGFFIRARDSGEVYAMGSTAADGATTKVTVADVGPSITEESFAGVPSGGSQTGTTPTAQSDTFSPAATRSYRGNGTHYSWNESFLFHGYNLAANGALRALAVFNRSAVSALTAGASMESGFIELVNAHTWANSGMTVRVGYTDHTSVPSTWDASGFNLIGTYTVERGAPLKIPLNATLLNAVKSGALNAIAVVPSSTSGTQYGYFKAAATKLSIKVRK